MSGILPASFFIRKPLDNFFNPLYKQTHAAVAQLVEQWTENPRVNSSILFGGTIFLFYPSEAMSLLPDYGPYLNSI